MIFSQNHHFLPFRMLLWAKRWLPVMVVNRESIERLKSRGGMPIIAPPSAIPRFQ
jgi:hypothetical protein